MYPSSHRDVKSGPILGHVTKGDEGSLAIVWETMTKRNLSSVGSSLFVVLLAWTTRKNWIAIYRVGDSWERNKSERSVG